MLTLSDGAKSWTTGCGTDEDVRCCSSCIPPTPPRARLLLDLKRLGSILTFVDIAVFLLPCDRTGGIGRDAGSPPAPATLSLMDFCRSSPATTLMS